MDGRITFGEALSLGILLTVLAGGGYALHSDIAQVRIDLSEKIDAKFGELDAKIDEVDKRLGNKIDAKIDEVDKRLGNKIDAKFGEVDAKVDEVNRRVTDLQERVAVVEAIVRVWVKGRAADGPESGDLSRAD